MLIDAFEACLFQNACLWGVASRVSHVDVDFVLHHYMVLSCHIVWIWNGCCTCGVPLSDLDYAMVGCFS